MNRLIGIFILIFLVGCKDDVENYNVLITKNNHLPIQIKGNRLKINPVIDPGKIYYHEGSYLIQDLKGKCNHYRLNKDFEIIDSFAQIGDGPGLTLENSPEIVNSNLINSDSVTIYSFAKNELQIWPPIRKSKSNSPINYNLPKTVFNVQRMIHLEQSKYLGINGMNSGMLYFMDISKSSTSITKVLPYRPMYDFNFKKDKFNDLYAGMAISNNSKYKVFYSYYRQNIYSIFNFDGSEYKEFHINKYFTKEEILLPDIFYYTWISGDDQLIFASYFGKSTANMGKSVVFPIQVINWDGEILLEFLPDISYSYFCYNSDSKSLLLIDINNENAPFVKYDLAELFIQNKIYIN